MPEMAPNLTVFFPTNSDSADILGMTELHSGNAVSFLCFFRCLWIARFPELQISISLYVCNCKRLHKSWEFDETSGVR